MRQCIFFLFVYFLFACGIFSNVRAQTASSDTNQITSMIDSCRAAGEVQCANNVLKLIQKKLTSVKNEKEKSFYQRAEIRTLRNIGNVYRDNLSNLSKAMEYYQLSRKKAEEVGDKLGLAAALLNIGNIYYDLKDYQSALEYQEKSFSMFREIGDKRGIGICLNAIANIYKSELNYSKALEYYSNSLAIQEERRDTFEIMTCYYNIGQAYSSLASEDKSNNLKAMDFFQQSLKFAKAINNAEGTINALEGIGEIFLDTGNPKKAQEYYTEALKLATPSANLWVQSEVYHTLRQVYEKQGLYKEALAMFDKHIALRDTIFSQKQSRDIAIKDAQYESDKKEAAMKAQQEKEREVAAAESKKQRVIIISVILGLLFAVVFAGYIFRSLRTTRKQKALIEEQKSIVETQKKEVESQKHLVEEKQKEIIDSITYAKRLQQAILPPMHFVKKHLPYSFILYKPKDIVAGDFYWMEEKDNIVFIAAADCTGHGVPGAMVSVVCCNALNRTVKEFGLRDTGKILDKVTELVLETFEKSGEDVKDGMDISLLSFNLMTKEIYWTGANNALWYIQDKEVIEITANKQPVGKHDNRKPFTTHKIDYQPNTVFYLLTDGYADQFGGPKGKKFKYKQLEEKIIAIKDKHMEEQQSALEQAFSDWKGTQEQVDDVSIIGIRL